MNRDTLGAIDIGSNAIRLLINYIEHDDSLVFKKAAFVRVPIRLGEDVFSVGIVEDAKKKRLCQAMQGFYHIMQSFNVKNFKAYATSALREAKNKQQIVECVKNLSSIDIEIISGKQEADTIFKAGENSDFINQSEKYVFLDVGGGSSEVSVYNNCKNVYSESFPIGTVRTIEGATDKKQMDSFKSELQNIRKRYSPNAIIGSGGNINKVFKLMAKKDKEPIHFVELKVLYKQLKSMSYEDRIKKLGLNSYRADVIVPAIKIFLTACKKCSINQIIVPKIGLADGIIHNLYTNKDF